MSQALHTPRVYKTTSLKKFFNSRIVRIKTALENETVQKVVLFGSILALLLVAANLESIL